MNKYNPICCHIDPFFNINEKNRKSDIIRQILEDLSAEENKQIICTSTKIEEESKKHHKFVVNNFAHKMPYLFLQESEQKLLAKSFGNPVSSNLKSILLQQKQIDLFHVHDLYRMSHAVRKAAKQRNIPYVISLYPQFEFFSDEENELLPKLKKKILDYGKIYDLFNKQERILLDAAGIICYKQKMYEELCERFPQKEILLSSLTISTTSFKVVARMDFRKRNKISKKAEVIISEGEIAPASNQMRLVELAQELKKQQRDFHIMLIGKVISQKYFELLKNKISTSNLQEHFSFRGDLMADPENLKKAYGTADYMLIPALQLHDNRSILRAWISRLPIVAFGSDDIKQMITHKKTGLLYENDTTVELLNQLEYIKNKSGFRMRLIHNAFEEGENNYTRRVVSERILDFYNKAIDKSKT